MLANPDSPTTAIPLEHLIPSSDHLQRMREIPPSRMFLIKKNLAGYRQKVPDGTTYDASQGDGGASLPGVPPEILDRAHVLQQEHGTAYDMPFGCNAFREAVVEQYWGLDQVTGLGPANVLASVGGRDGLVKAYSAMQALGHGSAGDMIVVSRVPWISYNWGPYGVGANVLLAPGREEDAWAYSEQGLQACVDFASTQGRKIAGLVITNPDNPTGRTLPVDSQVALAKKALELGIAFVLFDWMYHFVTDEESMDLNSFVQRFESDERPRLMFLDGLTKSLGASNVRNAHLIASEKVIKYISARASHSVIPSFYSMAVAMAAYEMGYQNASRTIVEPTNESRVVLKDFLDQHGLTSIMGKGYYAFINVGKWLGAAGWHDSEPLGQYLAENHGVAIVPGAFFSAYGKDWIRFSYATPKERTLGAAERLLEGLNALLT